MPVPSDPISRRRLRLLQGASAVAVFAGLASPAAAQLQGLRGAAHVGAASAAGAPGVAAPYIPGLSTGDAAGRNTAVARSLQNATRAQQAVNLAQQAQTAARQSAAAALPGGVPNGLVVGGLVPVANPLSAANDPTGLSTWQGANAPTQTTASGGAVTVEVQQTASRAILDWQSFNVGANTTLNFDQSQNGVAKPDWVVLNRVVGGLNSATGLRDSGGSPSQILGSIKAQGTVLLINQNGILFGPGAQVNTNSLIATSLEIGSQISAAGNSIPSRLPERDNLFLNSGLTGLSGQLTQTPNPILPDDPITVADPLLEGAVTVAAGAQITSGTGGYVILAAPQVINSGTLSSYQGQVSLAAGRVVSLIPSTGSTASGGNPNIRGFLVSGSDGDISVDSPPDTVQNTATGLILTPEGYASLNAGGPSGVVLNAGTVSSTTTVARNGYIDLSGTTVQLDPTSVLSITADDTVVIPQDPDSLANFKPSRIDLSGATAVTLGAGSLIYAPGATVSAGAGVGQSGSRVFVDTGAVIDVSGAKDVQIPASTNTVTISPVTRNDTANTPTQRSFFDHTSVTVDPRLSGVRSDGVVWVGSPLIPAQAFADQVGVSAAQILTKGGNVLLGAVNVGDVGAQTPDVVVKPGAVIDISGGWRSFAPGRVQTTKLISATGAIVDIGDASPDQVYVGIYNGPQAVQPRFGISQVVANPLLVGSRQDPGYIEGADAGSLTLKTSAGALEGFVYGQAFAGPLQALKGQLGTGTPTLYGDQRRLQAVRSELPAGGFLFLQEVQTGSLFGSDILITGQETDDSTAGLTSGQAISVDASGLLVPAPAARPVEAQLPLATQQTFSLSAPALTRAGLGQLSLYTSGALTVAADADLHLAPGGVFTAVTGRNIDVEGRVTAPSGRISLETAGAGAPGSIFAPTERAPGVFDVIVNGQLSAAGLWTNDYAASRGALVGAAYTAGGSISLTSAPREDLLGSTTGAGAGDVATVATTMDGTQPVSTTDVSGSIRVAGANSLLDVSAGGYVSPTGALTLTGKGGNVSLADASFYFPLAFSIEQSQTFTGTGFVTGFRVVGGANDAIPINPDAIGSVVAIGRDAIRGYGFGGGGTFSLATPAFGFGDALASTGTNLPLDFFSRAGFGAYKVTSYATTLTPNAFTNGLGGYNAVLSTQVLNIGSGQVLNLTQGGYSPLLTGDQTLALRNLPTGGALAGVLTPTIRPGVYYQRPVSLSLGGLIELKVGAGALVTGAPGASLSVAQLDDAGTIRIVGGTVSQVEALPSLYGGPGVLSKTSASAGTNTAAVYSATSLAGVFSTDADGAIDPDASSVANPQLTNGELATRAAVYLQGDLPSGVGLRIGSSGVIDLSGEVIVNPNVKAFTDGRQVVDGTVAPGGVLQTAANSLTAASSSVFTVSSFSNNPAYGGGGGVSLRAYAVNVGQALVAGEGARIDLSGASGTFDQLTSTGNSVSTPRWSDGGSLLIGSSFTLTGGDLVAQGGAAQAAGGLLSTPALTLASADPAAPTANLLSAAQIEGAGFGTLVVNGPLSATDADVRLSLGQAFFLRGPPSGLITDNQALLRSGRFFDFSRQNPTVSVSGGLEIDAPYIGLQSGYPGFFLGAPSFAGSGSGRVAFNAQALDVTGAVFFDGAVGDVTLSASADLRLIGVQPVQQVAGVILPPSLNGLLATSGDLTLKAAQVYATTGSTFSVTSAGAAGTITVAATEPTPATPYSAGSALTIQAANIVQAGVVRAPLGSLTLGSNTATAFAPATESLRLAAGSVTSVSADGLSIPYGTTTDQKEYYFDPAGGAALTAPPAAVLSLAGTSVVTEAGATVDLKGGGDLFAYEFVPGTGGSRDILSRFNADAFTSNGGFQYADGRQVYAIVPGLSDAAAAAFDPISSSDYGALYAPGGAGLKVYLNGGPGVPAGLYTLLPARYALLPGGMQVVEDTSVKTVPVGASVTRLDGSVSVTGYYAGLGGTQQSTARVFELKDRAVIDTYSKIALTSATSAFSAIAQKAGTTAPPLPADAARLVINPSGTVDLSGDFQTAAAAGGRGSQVDISAGVLQIVSTLGAPIDGVVQLSAGQLSALNASSLLIGGVRTDAADGTTALQVGAGRITVANDAAHPLTAPTVILAVDGPSAALTLNDGATIVAQGADTTGQTGALLISGVSGQTGQGALVRVSTAAQRLTTRTGATGEAPATGLTVGAATLQGASLLLDSTGGFGLSSEAQLAAADIALDAPAISFTQGDAAAGGLTITPSLQAALARATTLTLRSPGAVAFAAGSYGFGDLRLDAPGVAVDGAVTVTAKAVQLRNSAADLGACGGAGAPVCGPGGFALAANSLLFGDGVVRVFGADAGVSLAATGGIAYQGQGALDVGAAPLTLSAPFLRDRLAPATDLRTTVALPSLAISTKGALVLASTAAAAADDALGAPGAELTLSGDTVSVAGVDVRATAGRLSLASATGLTVGAGATLRTPGYARSFGDATDPYSISAPGGLLTLTAADGDIALAAGSTLSVSGGSGTAGALAIKAGRGAVSFGGAIDGGAAGAGAGFGLNEAGAFDLASFLTATRGAFSGEFQVRTGAGDLAIAAGQTLKALDVVLSADGGAVRLDGTIDVSGVNGGKVGLFGAQGVSLGAASRIAARASGYGATDTRQASGGQVELGVSGAGAIAVAQGATIDVGADHPDARIVEGETNTSTSGAPAIATTYAYVAGDKGGTLTLRAPVVGDGPVGAVNVGFGGLVVGARSIVLEGYKAFDLGAVASGGAFSGVTVADGVATLDTNATGLPNFLADAAPGTLVDFIQRFDVSQSYGALGGLAALPAFHAQPGVELNYAGDITLASNWNLGAGVVDVAAATAAGLMVADPGVAGAFSVVPGSEAAIFADYTKLTYRVGGAVTGEPGALAIKAGGQLTVNGSITDGFFSFGDQTDPAYLGTFGGKTYQPAFSLGTTSVNFDQTTLNLNSVASTTTVAATIPYRAAANSPGALGQGVNGAGDPLGGAELFPLVQATGGTRAVDSWSYALTGGAAAGADPSGVVAGAPGGVTVQGFKSYAVQALSSFNGDLGFRVSGVQGALSAQDAVNALLARNPSLRPTSMVTLNFGSAPAAAKAALLDLATQYSATHPGQFTFLGQPGAYTGVRTMIQYEAGFLAQVTAAFPGLQTAYNRPGGAGAVQTAVASTLVRTGAGSIAIAAAADIDLRNGAQATFLNAANGATATAATGFQLGGAPVYTAGARVVPAAVTGIDTTTGATVTLDPTGFATTGTNVGVFGYGYGLSAPRGGSVGLSGIQVADGVYADGGGDVAVDAGGDVLSRRDAYTEGRLVAPTSVNALVNANFVGFYDQPWRVALQTGPAANVTHTPNIGINPLLFGEGVGALGGGSVAVRAGGSISDLSVVSDTSVATGAASGGVKSGQVSQGLVTYGGGSVTVAAWGDIRGGRIDVASGSATISAGGGVGSAGTVALGNEGGALGASTAVDNLLRLRLTDATVALSAQRDIVLQGIAALGIRTNPVFNGAPISNGYAFDFYSPTSGVAVLTDGSLSMANATTGDVVAFGGSFSNIDPRAPLPASFSAVALTGDLALNTNVSDGLPTTALPLLLHPSPRGTLTLAAGGDIAPVTVAVLDSIPGAVGDLPITLPGSSQAQLQAQHDPALPRAGDTVPNRVYAGGDITDLALYTPKQTRIGAGRDIVNMVFFGQNQSAGDVTRVVAGRDITATSRLINAFPAIGPLTPSATQLPAVEGNTFILGGPGALILEAGRDLGPFLNSAVLTSPSGLPASYAGGVLTVGNANNPYLPSQGASLDVEFGVGKGYDYQALTDYYLNPANMASAPDYLFSETLNTNNVYIADRSQPIYAPKLVAFMQSGHAGDLVARFGTAQVSYDQAYAAFIALPVLQQRPFLQQVYFNELSLTSVPGPTLNQYTRGYTAVNLLFPASLGYTSNNLGGGSNGANARVQTGDLDLRLATIETQYGGGISILGPGGRVLAGSTVATAQQAARRYSEAPSLYAGRPLVSSGAINKGPLSTALGGPVSYQAIQSIPAGFEGVLTLRGGPISTFTDGDVVLNQSRLFTEQGGNVTLWSSNGDLNAGEGPKTSANFPPVAVKADANGYFTLDQTTGVTGAGIAAFQPAPGTAAPDVFLIAPRGTVDAGAAGVRVAGNLYVAAARVANADNFQVAGTAIGLPPTSTVVNVAANATAASSAAVQAAVDAVRRATASPAERSIISVDILGFGDE